MSLDESLQIQEQSPDQQLWDEIQRLNQVVAGLESQLAEMEKQRNDAMNQVADVNGALLQRNAPRPCGECKWFKAYRCINQGQTPEGDLQSWNDFGCRYWERRGT